jgi:hypothetical protein
VQWAWSFRRGFCKIVDMRACQGWTAYSLRLNCLPYEGWTSCTSNLSRIPTW